jgi:hypothetical protein
VRSSLSIKSATNSEQDVLYRVPLLEIYEAPAFKKRLQSIVAGDYSFS